MQIDFAPNNPQVIILKAETRHDAYDLGAFYTTLVKLGRSLIVTVVHEHESEPDYIALQLSLA